VDRRHVVGGGLLAGLTSLVANEPADAAAQRNGDGDDRIADAVSGLRRTLERQFDARFEPSRAVAQIREQQRVFIRGNQKFPDFIEVGLQMWESVYDWHIRHLQPVSVARTADGRYTMIFMFTTLVLRPDLDVNYVGYGYDAKG
jgi:hypothetical protein